MLKSAQSAEKCKKRRDFIGFTIRTHRESRCLAYAGFFKKTTHHCIKILSVKETFFTLSNSSQGSKILFFVLVQKGHNSLLEQLALLPNLIHSLTIYDPSPYYMFNSIGCFVVVLFPRYIKLIVNFTLSFVIYLDNLSGLLEGNESS